MNEATRDQVKNHKRPRRRLSSVTFCCTIALFGISLFVLVRARINVIRDPDLQALRRVLQSENVAMTYARSNLEDPDESELAQANVSQLRRTILDAIPFLRFRMLEGGYAMKRCGELRIQSDGGQILIDVYPGDRFSPQPGGARKSHIFVAPGILRLLGDEGRL